MKVGITGANGFIGRHLSLMTSYSDDVELVPFRREFFDDADALKEFVEHCDVIIHTAGINRHEDEDFLYKTNIALSQKLTVAASVASNTPNLIYLSSTHRDRDTAYGRSKKDSEEIFKKYTSEKGGSVSILILPNIFGEEQKSHYNSVVATFTEEILTGAPSHINPDGEVEFLHVRHVVLKCLELIQKHTDDCNLFFLRGIVVPITSLYTLLSSFGEYVQTGVIPELKNPFEIDLFNMFRYTAASIRGYSPFGIELKQDERGVLFEVLRTGTLGQVFSSVTKPGYVRGRHFHTRKIERFCVIEGSAVIECVNQLTKKTYSFNVSGELPQNIDMLTYHYHSIKNVGITDLRTLFWANEHFNQSDTDTFS